jgi:hypothetical protein
VAGFYVPQDGDLYVVSRSGRLGPVERTTFAHEYTHALQDQHFPLLKALEEAAAPGAPANSDRDYARLALIEGDATLAMTYWAQQHLSPLDLLGLLASSLEPAQQQALAAMPPFLRNVTLFPYQDGLQFVLGLQVGGDWTAVDRAFGAPPQSTEQVLHPDKYAASEQPLAVALPADLATRMGGGWSVDSQDTLGELQVRAWLQAVGGPGAAQAAAVAAAGWGGDRVAVLAGPGGAWGLALRTVWDSDPDASEFLAQATSAVAAAGNPGRATSGRAPREAWVFIASDATVATRLEAAATGS